MDRLFFGLGSLSAALGVALGAFGAHALKARLPLELLEIYETAVRYHLVHAIGLLGVGWAASRWPSPAVAWSGWLMVAGTLLFSGSLYALALTGVRRLGAITPLGGVAWIVAWLLLAWTVWRR